MSHQGWRLHRKGSTFPVPPPTIAPQDGCRSGSAGLTETQALPQSLPAQTPMGELHLGQGAETCSSRFLAMLFSFCSPRGRPFYGETLPALSTAPSS